MVRAHILTSWSTVAGVNTPTILVDYPALDRYSDLTGQPSANIQPEPNTFVAEIIASDEIFDLIDVDTRYAVLSSETVASSDA